MTLSESKPRGTSKSILSLVVEKSVMAEHIWKEKRNHLLLWHEVKIIDVEEHRRMRRFKKISAYVGL